MIEDGGDVNKLAQNPLLPKPPFSWNMQLV